MSSPQAGTADTRAGAARAFARSLNILLKYVRLYGVEHKLSSMQFETAWRELCAAMPADAAAGFLFGVSGSKLLLDGVPLETGPAESSFAHLLSAAGLASIYFSVELTRDDFTSLVDAFANAGSRPSAIARELKRRFGDASSPIRVNEIHYVAQDGNGDPLPAQLAVRALGADFEKLRDWLSDPQKLLQLIAAADGEKGGGEGNGNGSGPGAGSGKPVLKQDDVTSVLKLLSQLGKLVPGDGSIDPAQLRQEIGQAPVPVQSILQSALAEMGRQAATEADPNLLVKVAEHLAIQFALERFEKGEVRVNAVREMLERMGQEIETLRKVLREHEEKMGRAGILAESYTEILDRQFWAAVPEQGKRSVLLSPDAWCIPPRNIRDYVEQLQARREHKLAVSILDNYAACIRSADAEARRRTALGLSELAEVYSQVDPGLLRSAIQRTGEQLQEESGLELQTLLSATVVRLTQEGCGHADFLAVGQALECAERLEKHRPELGKDVRRRIGVESRLRKFISDGVHAAETPPGLTGLLKREPRAATDELAAQYSRCQRREECDRVVELARGLGAEAVARLTELLRGHPAAEAVPTIGLLSHLDVETLKDWLPQRLPEWGRSVQHAVVRQIGMGAEEVRSRLLLELLDVFDPAVLPMALDEIGETSDPLATVRLLRLAEGELPALASPYVQVKAIEALSRLRETHAAPLLHRLVNDRGLLGWKHPREVRIVATQALIKLEPGYIVPANSGLTVAELKLGPLDNNGQGWVRNRRYCRVAPEQALPAFVQTARGRCGMKVNSLSLGGGKGVREGRMNVGIEATLNLQIGMRNVSARVLVREAGAEELAFEIIHIDHNDRLRLRRLIAQQAQGGGGR